MARDLCVHEQIIHAPNDESVIWPACRLACEPVCNTPCDDYTPLHEVYPRGRFCDPHGLLNLVARMVEECVLEHDWNNAIYWATIGGMQEDAAIRAVRQARTEMLRPGAPPRTKGWWKL